MHNHAYMRLAHVQVSVVLVVVIRSSLLVAYRTVERREKMIECQNNPLYRPDRCTTIRPYCTVPRTVPYTCHIPSTTGTGGYELRPSLRHTCGPVEIPLLPLSRAHNSRRRSRPLDFTLVMHPARRGPRSDVRVGLQRAAPGATVWASTRRRPH